MDRLNDKPDELLAPVSILKIPNSNYVAFSDNARFIMAENGDQFAVYDAENDKAYAYRTKQPLDAPQAHASWMDGHRITYVSGGKVIAFDFDSVNLQTLVVDNPAVKPLFDQRYQFLYTFTADSATGSVLTSTALRTPADQ